MDDRSIGLQIMTTPRSAVPNELAGTPATGTASTSQRPRIGSMWRRIVGMTSTGLLGEFLRSRRARLDPATVGLPLSPVPRRGRGLRREEVAAIAGVSVDYYARLEQGRVGNVSDQVLTAIEDALRLDPLEREHCAASSALHQRGRDEASRRLDAVCG